MEGAAGPDADHERSISHFGPGSSEAAPRLVRGSAEQDFEDPLATMSDTARNLLVAARQLLAEEGFEALSLDAIAKRSGENKAMIAYYFGNKAGLVEALLEFVIRDCHEAFRDHVRSLCPREHSTGPAADAFGTGDAGDHVLLLAQLLPQVLHNGALSRRLARLQESNAYLLLEHLGIAHGQEDHLDSDSGCWARLCCAAIDGLAVQAAVDPEFDLPAAYRVLGRLLANGPLRRRAMSSVGEEEDYRSTRPDGSSPP